MSKVTKNSQMQLEGFQASEFSIASGKMTLGYLEHPFFSLKTNAVDMSVLEYTANNGKMNIKISPSASGRMNIKDADFVIFLQAKLVQMKKEGVLTTTTPVITIDTYEFLSFCNRSLGGKSYSNMKNMLDRVSGTSIEITTSIDDDFLDIKNTTMIDPEWEAVVEKKGQKGLLKFKVKCRSWFVEPILESEGYLTIDKAYFDIDKSTERRLWQIARKHAHTSKFTISWAKFYNKVGVSATLSEFRSRLRAVMKKNDGLYVVQEYQIRENEGKTGIIMTRTVCNEDRTVCNDENPKEV
jgi:plasmid replication initiation protein